MGDAFEIAETRIVQNKESFGEQQPWLDDNYDGVYSGFDGKMAKEIYLGMAGVSAAEPPYITQVHSRIELPDNVSTANLWVKTFPVNDGINRVIATLKSQDMRLLNMQEIPLILER